MAAGYGVATFRILFGVAASVMYPAFGDRVIDKEVQNVLMGYLLWVAYILNIGVVSWRYWVEFGTGAKTA